MHVAGDAVLCLCSCVDNRVIRPSSPEIPSGETRATRLLSRDVRNVVSGSKPPLISMEDIIKTAVYKQGFNPR